MSPLSNQVIAAGYEGLKRKSRPYQISAEDFFQPVDELKTRFAKMVDVDDPQRVVIIPSASYGFAGIAHNISVKSNQNVVVVKEQFPSNVYCWHRLCNQNSFELRVAGSGDSGIENNHDQNILDAIDENTVLVSMGILHWADGTVFDIAAIREKTLRVGAKLVLDGTQAIGALPFSVNRIQPDALVCAAYKWLMGPYSIGLAYFGPGFDNGIPLEENWINRVRSDDFQGQVGYTAEYRPKATRYDMGEKSNFINVPMLNQSIAQIMDWGVDGIQEYCRKISQKELELLQNHGFVLADESSRAHHLFGLQPPRGFDYQVAKSVLGESGVHVSFRGKSIRVSPHVYNTEEDMSKLRGSLIQALL
jgi:selenocysteine lyase/cysteine desulfurase